MEDTGVTQPMAGSPLRLLLPFALLLGVVLFGIALLALGIEAAGEDPQPLDPSSLTTANGTAVLAYPIKSFASGSNRVQVSYAFPNEPGDAYVVHCEDLDAMRRGEAPAEPLLAFTQLREGRFVATEQTLPVEYGSRFRGDPSLGVSRGCEPAVAFSWSATGGDPAANRPAASVTLHHTAFDAGRYWLLLLLMTAGASLALVGGLAWARPRAASAPLPGSDDSPIEVLRASLDRMGGQLERTRRHLLLAGVLGLFLWYPILVPWTWRQAQRTSDNPLFPWAVAGLTLAFLAVLTGLWARELHRLDRELVAWRARMSQLRERENSLMETL